MTSLLLTGRQTLYLNSPSKDQVEISKQSPKAIVDVHHVRRSDYAQRGELEVCEVKDGVDVVLESGGGHGEIVFRGISMLLPKLNPDLMACHSLILITSPLWRVGCHFV
jgi:hypothetical protein